MPRLSIRKLVHKYIHKVMWMVDGPLTAMLPQDQPSIYEEVGAEDAHTHTTPGMQFNQTHRINIMWHRDDESYEVVTSVAKRDAANLELNQCLRAYISHVRQRCTTNAQLSAYDLCNLHDYAKCILASAFLISQASYLPFMLRQRFFRCSYESGMREWT